LYISSEAFALRFVFVVSFVRVESGELFEFVEKVGFLVGLRGRNDFVDVDGFGETSSKEDGCSPVLSKLPRSAR